MVVLAGDRAGGNKIPPLVGAVAGVVGCVRLKPTQEAGALDQ